MMFPSGLQMWSSRSPIRSNSSPHCCFWESCLFWVRRIWRIRTPEDKGETPGHLVCGQIILLTLILLLAFMLTNKVFSPQYMIWVGPLMAILVAVHKNMWKMGILVLIASAMTQGIFPHLYELLNQFHPAMVILLNLRNALLIVILITADSGSAKIVRKKSTPPDSFPKADF